MLDLARLTKTPAEFPSKAFGEKDGGKLISLASLPKQGERTRVFPKLGLPKRRDSELAGIVLVNEGGGTAVRERVENCTQSRHTTALIAVEGRALEHLNRL